MNINLYDFGNKVRCKVEFTTGGVVNDPSEVTFKALTPTGSAIAYVYGTDPEIIKESTGVYRVELEPTVSGTWYYRFESSGSGKAAREHEFEINQSRFY